mmetsp:Transcript_51926/g.145030  ORF Transcript_51926/g.145030 Transcript_51926/m.145030 type:complete len:143 (+) Transcript_51926:502-930(+)
MSVLAGVPEVQVGTCVGLGTVPNVLPAVDGVLGISRDTSGVIGGSSELGGEDGERMDGDDGNRTPLTSASSSNWLANLKSLGSVHGVTADGGDGDQMSMNVFLISIECSSCCIQAAPRLNHKGSSSNEASAPLRVETPSSMA